MITVGIPVHNEQNTVEKVILSVLKQISASDEMIVIADGCTDMTCHVVERMSRSHKQVRLIIEKERKGKASALNSILKLAKGDIIVLIDGDVEPDEHAVNELIKHFNDAEVGAVSAHVIPVVPKGNMFHDYIIVSYEQIHQKRLRENKAGNHWHLSGSLCAYRKEAMDVIPSDLKGALDALMGVLIRNKGYKIVYEPNARVYKRAPLTMRDFVREKSRIMAGFCQLRQVYGVQPSGSDYLPLKTVGHARPRRKFDSFLPPFLPTSFLPSFVPSFLFSKHSLAILLAYFYSWLHGWWLIRSGKPLAVVWKRVDSTK